MTLTIMTLNDRYDWIVGAVERKLGGVIGNKIDRSLNIAR